MLFFMNISIISLILHLLKVQVIHVPCLPISTDLQDDFVPTKPTSHSSTTTPQ